MKTVELHLPYTHSEADLAEAYARKSGHRDSGAEPFVILRKSIDARKKSDIRIVYQLAARSDCPPVDGIAGLPRPEASDGVKPRVVVVGAGPAGLFATLYLAMAGCSPLLVERGQPVERRQLDVARFWQSGTLDPESNVQFGEGGAGTFSDGKLNTGIRDPRRTAVLEEFVLLGAPPEILYFAKPHIGTDRLRDVMVAMRAKIVGLGGEVRFGTRLAGLATAPDPAGGRPRLTGALLADRTGGQTTEVPADALVLAIGHSARDTFRLLQADGITLVPKPFAVGVRIEHRQAMIDQAQYGDAAGHPALPPAEYKLSAALSNGRSLYTFCMCPGGQVIAAASSAGESVTNGMSLFSRADRNANSALLVPVHPEDFESEDPLAGVRFQERMERSAFAAGGNGYEAPAQLVGPFLGRKPDGVPANDGSRRISIFPDGLAVDPSYTNGVRFTDLAGILPGFVTESIREGLPLLGRKLPGFADPLAVLTGVETRSSSPVRILRDDQGQASLPGLFPCGEGAGYAGGIMSAAVDGLRCAEAVLRSAKGQDTRPMAAKG